MKNLNLEIIESILNGDMKYSVDLQERKSVINSFNFLKESSEEYKIYGVNTGFGPMVDYQISKSDQISLQYNLIRSHACGMGDKLDGQAVKLVMILRLHTFLQAKSGVSVELIDTLLLFIENDILPDLFEHGGVGASGDLIQLAHLALGLIGEGDAVEGKNQSARISGILKRNKISPHTLLMRDGLALMNGTSCMTALSTINIINAKKLLSWGVKVSSMMLEIFRSYDDYTSATLNEAKKHKGQQDIARRIRDHLEGSELICKRYNEEKNQNNFQEFYSVRCSPQILGPILDSINYAEQVIENEINSVDDNPIIDIEQNKIVHGGNFHGDYVSLEMDKVKISMTKLTILTERQLNLLLHSNVNKILPPFLNTGKLGLNYGMQGAQFTATSTTAENQMLSNPMSIHSISSNNDNQDVVSMGTNSSLITKKVIDNAFHVMAIQLVACVKSLKILKGNDNPSDNTIDIIKDIDNIIGSPKDSDEVFYDKLSSVEDYLRNS